MRRQIATLHNTVTYPRMEINNKIINKFKKLIEGLRFKTVYHVYEYKICVSVCER